MSEEQSIDINLIDLVNLSANILNKLFIKAGKDKAKPIFRDIKQGKNYPLGSITVQEKWTPKLQLALDYSEFRGPGFNYDVFEVALRTVLQQISTKLAAKAELQILSSDNGSTLLHVPGVIKLKDQFNVMLIAYELNDVDFVTIKLMFVNPDQYEQLAPSAAES